MSFDTDIEAEIVEKGLVAPRITVDHIEKTIVSEHYFTAADGRRGAMEAETYVGREQPQEGESDLIPLGLLTFCVLVLRNGFMVTGESACASSENFDAEIGRKIARGNAVQKIWGHEGYLLREKLHAEGLPVDEDSVSFDVGYIAGAAARAHSKDPVVDSSDFKAGYVKGRTTPFSDEA